MGNRCEGEKSEINQKDGAMTRYSRDNQTQKQERENLTLMQWLHKRMSVNADEGLFIYVPGLSVIDSSVHVILRLMFVKVKLATMMLELCEENNTFWLVVGR